ncbi:MAG TPA: L,D-transpeptidase [Candidatus Saccharimonadia bacterium]|nr:L,D-transpeptidase [Candidatus Saccharimonadia bacterium]
MKSLLLTAKTKTMHQLADRLLTGTVAASLALMLASCASKPKPAPGPQQQQAFKMYEWNAELAAKTQGAASVVIYLDKQKATFFKGGKEIGWTYVASGTASHPTPSGHFKVMEKTPDKISNLYGKLLDFDGNVVDSDFNISKETLPEGNRFSPARMPLYMRLTSDGVGMHVGPIPKPGRAASHGCIRLPRFMAEKFFANVSVGTPVTIHATSPADGRAVAPTTEKKRSGLFSRS